MGETEKWVEVELSTQFPLGKSLVLAVNKNYTEIDIKVSHPV